MVQRTATAFAAGIAAALGAWYLIGERSSPGADPADGRILVPPPVPPAVEHVAGVAAVLLLVAFLVLAIRRRRLVTGTSATALLVVAGVLLGAIGRIASAATIGANIGGGIAVLFGLPLVGVLVLAAVVVLVRAGVRGIGENGNPAR